MRKTDKFILWLLSIIVLVLAVALILVTYDVRI